MAGTLNPTLEEEVVDKNDQDELGVSYVLI